MFVCLVDEVEGYFDPEQEPFTVVLAKDLGIPKWEHFAFKYSILELNTAVKPYVLEYLFQTRQLDRLVYFDPDIELHRSLTELDELLDTYGIVLTPHILEPLNDDHSPSEVTLLRAGIYNLGFLGVSRQPDLAVLKWWKERLYRYCKHDTAQGLFVDQRWMDFAPALFPKTHVLRDPTYNVAYWNFGQRLVQNDGQCYVIDGQPIHFVHYSGFMTDNLEAVSKHQNRFRLSDLTPALQQLMHGYRQALLDQQHEVCKNWPYAYGRFDNNVPISPQARALLMKIDPDGDCWEKPFHTGPASYFDCIVSNLAGQSDM